MPDRYGKAEEAIKKHAKCKKEDKKAELAKALDDAEMEFSFASIPVNPFKSDDALMSYLFNDRHRFKPAYDSDYTDDDESSDENIETETSKTLDTNNNNSTDLKSVSNSNNGSLLNLATDQSSHNGYHKNKKDGLAEEIISNGIDSNNESESTSNKISKSTTKESKKKRVKKGNPKLSNGEPEPTTNGKKDQSRAPEALTNGVESKNGKSEASCNGDNVDELIIKSDDEYQIPTNDSKEVISKMEEEIASKQNPEKVWKIKKKKSVYEASNVQCPKCEKFVDKHTLREYRSAISFTMQRLKDIKMEDPSKLSDLYNLSFISFQIVLFLLLFQVSLIIIIVSIIIILYFCFYYFSYEK